MLIELEKWYDRAIRIMNKKVSTYKRYKYVQKTSKLQKDVIKTK